MAYRNVLVSKVPHILKALYDLDILEEKVILDWGAKRSKKTVGKELAEEIHVKAAPFIKWLKEAEEEESDSGDEEDEDDEVDVDFNDRVIGTKIVQVETASPKKPVLDKNNSNDSANDVEDIDIDAI